MVTGHGVAVAAVALAATALLTSPASAEDVTACPSGYHMAPVHLLGQRVESDPGGNEVLTYNTESTDMRYVVAQMCVRRINETESEAAFWGRSMPSVLLAP